MRSSVGYYGATTSDPSSHPAGLTVGTPTAGTVNAIKGQDGTATVPAGDVGQVIMATFSNVSVNSATVGIQLAVITLTPGDWDVWARASTANNNTSIGVGHELGTTLPGVDIFPGISTTSRYVAINNPNGSNLSCDMAIPPLKVSANTDVYFLAESTSAGNSHSEYGYIAARRRS